MSFFGSVETTAAEALVPSTNETRMLVAPSTTWRAVMIEPLALMITPAPRPEASPSAEARSVSISTSEGRICW